MTTTIKDVAGTYLIQTRTKPLWILNLIVGEDSTISLRCQGLTTPPTPARFTFTDKDTPISEKSATAEVSIPGVSAGIGIGTMTLSIKFTSGILMWYAQAQGAVVLDLYGAKQSYSFEGICSAAPRGDQTEIVAANLKNLQDIVQRLHDDVPPLMHETQDLLESLPDTGQELFEEIFGFFIEAIGALGTDFDIFGAGVIAGGANLGLEMALQEDGGTLQDQVANYQMRVRLNLQALVGKLAYMGSNVAICWNEAFVNPVTEQVDSVSDFQSSVFVPTTDTQAGSALLARFKQAMLQATWRHFLASRVHVRRMGSEKGMTNPLCTVQNHAITPAFLDEIGQEWPQFFLKALDPAANGDPRFLWYAVEENTSFGNIVAGEPVMFSKRICMFLFVDPHRFDDFAPGAAAPLVSRETFFENWGLPVHDDLPTRHDPISSCFWIKDPGAIFDSDP